MANEIETKLSSELIKLTDRILTIKSSLNEMKTDLAILTKKVAHHHGKSNVSEGFKSEADKRITNIIKMIASL